MADGKGRIRAGLALLLAAAALTASGGPGLASRATVRPAVPLAGDSLELQWRHRIPGQGLGFDGFAIADLDGDGSQEVVATAVAYTGQSLGVWQILRWDGTTYTLEWTSELFTTRIRCFAVANVDADPTPEVIVAVGYRLLVYDGATRQIQASIATPFGITGVEIADIDGDSSLEAVLCSNTEGLFVYSFPSGALEYQNPAWEGWDLAVGNVDTDPALEIVIGGDYSPGYVIDGSAYELQWTASTGFGYIVRLADVDGDSIQEVVGAEEWHIIRIYDVDLHSIKATIETRLDIGALEVVDVEGDGPLEIVYGDYQHGDVHVHNAATRALKWEIQSPGIVLSKIAIGDADNDGGREVVWASDALYFASVATRAIEFVLEEEVRGSFVAFSSGDVDADGQPELLSAPFYGWDPNAVVHRHDAVTGALEQRMSVPSSANYVRRAGNANVDADPQHEIFVALSSDRSVVCFDALTGALQWRAPLLDSQETLDMELADVDLDGRLEVVVGSSLGNLASGHLYVFDAATGVLERRIPSSFYSYLDLVRVANVDADPQPEIVAAGMTQRVFVFDAVTGVVNALPDLETVGLATADQNGDGIAEILVATYAGSIHRVHPVTGEIQQTVGPWGRINAFVAADVDGSPGLEYVMVIDFEKLVVARPDGCVVLSRDVEGANIGEPDALLVRDIDADGKVEVVLGIGPLGFDVYEINLTAGAPCLSGLLSISIADLTVPEGASGSASAAFTVTLAAPSADTVSVEATTSNGSAVAGSDYTATGPITLTFAPGVTSQTFSVPILGDRIFEPDETFQVSLANPVNAPIWKATAVGTIQNDDLPARTFVSAAGNDASDCSVQATPCRSIAAAITKTEDDGEVFIVSSGDYETAPLAITKGIKVTAPPGVVALVRQSIHVDAPFGRVALRGLTLKGSGAGVGLTLDDADSLSLENVEIDGRLAGVRVGPGLSSLVSLSGVVIRASGTGVEAESGRFAIDGSRFEGNGRGLDIRGGDFSVSESTFVANSVYGITVSGGLAEIQRSEFSFNGVAVHTSSGAIVRIGRSRVFSNAVGLEAGAGSVFHSRGTSAVRGNVQNVVGVVTLIPEQ